MQTFLPLPSFQQSAKVLDYRRLGNQRNEALVIYRTIKNPHAMAWKNHPCTVMWRPYSEALALYHNEIITEWIRRGYNNRMPLLPIQQTKLRFPPWLGNTDFHSSHRSALLFKDLNWYSQFGWIEQPRIAYIWPVIHEDSPFTTAFGEL